MIFQFRKSISALALLAASSHVLAYCERHDQDHSAYVDKNVLCDDDVINENLPRFTDFRTEVHTGPLSTVDYKSLPTAKKWSTTISRQYASGINFAGKYSIASWGCGTGCLQSVIIDGQSGRIFRPKEISMVISRPTQLTDVGMKKLDLNDDGHIHFQKNSSLLIVVGKLGEFAKKVGIYHFYWNGNNLQLLKKIERNDP